MWLVCKRPVTLKLTSLIYCLNYQVPAMTNCSSCRLTPDCLNGSAKYSPDAYPFSVKRQACVEPRFFPELLCGIDAAILHEVETRHQCW